MGLVKVYEEISKEVYEDLSNKSQIELIAYGETLQNNTKFPVNGYGHYTDRLCKMNDKYYITYYRGNSCD